MTALAPPVLSTDQFTWVAAANELVAEASDLGDYVGRLFDDAADVGFNLVSARTGAVVTYSLEHDEYDAEGDLLSTVFAAVDENAMPRERSLPQVRVLND